MKHWSGDPTTIAFCEISFNNVHLWVPPGSHSYPVVLVIMRMLSEMIIMISSTIGMCHVSGCGFHFKLVVHVVHCCRPD